MRERIAVALAVVMLLGGAVAPLIAAGLGANTEVAVHPAAGTYQVGQQVEIQVWIEDVIDLYGADVQLEFDAQRLAAVDANPGWPGIQVQPVYDWFYPDLIARNAVTYTLGTTGTIWLAATQLNPRPPVSGTGALLSFQAEAIAGGEAWLRFKKVRLADSNAMPIEAVAVGALYDIDESYRVCLPLAVVTH